MTTATGSKVGTISQFIQDRGNNLTRNREQIEAFGKELFLILLQIINATENRFGLRSVMTFPRLRIDAFDLIDFLIWSVCYFEWMDSLGTEERKTLNAVRITWE